MVIYMIFSSRFSGHSATFESFFCAAERHTAPSLAPPRSTRALPRQLFSAGQYFILSFFGAVGVRARYLRAANLCKLAKTTRRLDLPVSCGVRFVLPKVNTHNKKACSAYFCGSLYTRRVRFHPALFCSRANA